MKFRLAIAVLGGAALAVAMGWIPLPNQPGPDSVNSQQDDTSSEAMALLKRKPRRSAASSGPRATVEERTPTVVRPQTADEAPPTHRPTPLVTAPAVATNVAAAPQPSRELTTLTQRAVEQSRVKVTDVLSTIGRVAGECHEAYAESAAAVARLGAAAATAVQKRAAETPARRPVEIPVTKTPVVDEPVVERSSPDGWRVAQTPKTASDSRSATAPASSPEMDKLQAKVRQALDLYRNRLLNTRDNGSWEIMHSLIAYGPAQEVYVGNPGGTKANAIGWICFNGQAAGERLFYLDKSDIIGRTGPGLQGHGGQFLAMLAQWQIDRTYPMKIQDRDFTIEDLVRSEQRTCRPNSELTFKLIGLMHYLPSDTVWQDTAGNQWTLPRIIKEELAQPIIGAACGGTHRLFGLSWAYRKREQRGEPVDGQYARARTYIRDYQEYTFKLQNPDGSFSTAFFAGRGDSSDPQRKLETTGHIAEWLTLSLDDAQLREPRMVKAIDFLASLLVDRPQYPWKVGPLGHALHTLNMYDTRVFQSQPLLKPKDSAAATPAAETAARPATPVVTEAPLGPSTLPEVGFTD